MSIRKTGVLALWIARRRLLALSPLMGLLFSGCLIGMGGKDTTDQVRVEFHMIDRVSLDLNGGSVRIEGTGTSFGSYVDILAVSFELTDDTFRCLMLAESARRDGFPLAIHGYKDGPQHNYAYNGRFMPSCAAPIPSPTPSPDPSASPVPSPSPTRTPTCHDT